MQAIELHLIGPKTLRLQHHAGTVDIECGSPESARELQRALNVFPHLQCKPNDLQLHPGELTASGSIQIAVNVAK